MSGFDCQFIVKPVDYLQSHCPICLLILREPFQVTCCGKSFCKACIQRIGAGNKICPTCNRDNFELFQNKGLQQPLYGFEVSCSNMASSCDWQGELGKLDQHLNLNPDKDKLSVGCAYTNVKCLFCKELYQRSKIEHHQGSQCTERPFTCSMCEEYNSTYDDVITNHTPVCKCRPVECPNSCGANNLQHQHLEEHVSTQCPLSYVDCEFSDAGCDAKVHRKDLHSHMEENMVTHVSLLARENKKLKLQLKDQEEMSKKMGLLEEKIEKVKFQLTRVPPLYLECLDVKTKLWKSEPFYSHVGGYKLQLEVNYDTAHVMEISGKPNCCLFICGYIKDRQLPLPCKQLVTVLIIDQEKGNHFKMEIKCNVDEYDYPFHGVTFVDKYAVDKFVKNSHLLFRIERVITL